MAAPDCAALHPGYKTLCCPSGKTPRRSVNQRGQKYSTLPKFGNSVSIAATRPLGRGAYRDRHERGPGGGGRGWRRREELCRAGDREQGPRAYDRCHQRTAKSCGP